MPRHNFNGFKAHVVPLLSNIFYALPSNDYKEYVFLKLNYIKSINNVEICDWLLQSCKGNTMCVSQALNFWSIPRVVIYFENAQDVVMFKLAHHDIIEYLYVNGKTVKDKPSFSFNIKKLREKSKRCSAKSKYSL